MSYRLLIFVAKKEGISHEDFKTKYEAQTALISEIAGDAAPVRYTRRYIAQTPDGKPFLLAGNPDSIDFDAVIEIEFDGELGFANFAAKTATEEAQAKIKAGEGEIVDTAKTKLIVVGSVEVREK